MINLSMLTYSISLARLLILIKKGGLLQLKLVGVGVNIYLWARKKNSCILPKFVMHVTNDQFSDKFNNGQKKINMADLLRFFAFYVNNLTLWAR